MYSLKRVAVVLPVLVLVGLGSLTAARADTVPFTGTRHEELPSPQAGGLCGAVRTLIANPVVGIETGMSNFGAFVPDEVSCLHTPFPAQITDGVFTFTFADGDTLMGLFDGYVTSVVITPTYHVVTPHQSYLITGGTGLFAGATGSLEEAGAGYGTGTLAVVDYTFSGQITAPKLSPVPEPATLALLGTGLAAVAARFRRYHSRDPQHVTRN